MSIETVKFRGRHISPGGLTALITGGISIIMLVVFCILASTGRTIGAFAGIVSVIAAIANILGLIVSILATRERDIYMAIPIAGMIVNGISFLLYVIIYMLGAV
ncbi:MAG: hypothetical protein J6Y89_08555 [Lachnospiraceae bacterium]|nr:hypothetical protein [Lachnospiraceae bacterium]